jgi:hypothetical protein
MAQQTAVEWLVEQICTSEMSNFIFHQEIKQAKAMEKEQIINAFENGIISYDNQDRITDDINNDSEQYYNETYNK